MDAAMENNNNQNNNQEDANLPLVDVQWNQIQKRVSTIVQVLAQYTLNRKLSMMSMMDKIQQFSKELEQLHSQLLQESKLINDQMKEAHVKVFTDMATNFLANCDTTDGIDDTLVQQLVISAEVFRILDCGRSSLLTYSRDFHPDIYSMDTKMNELKARCDEMQDALTEEGNKFKDNASAMVGKIKAFIRQENM